MAPLRRARRPARLRRAARVLRARRRQRRRRRARPSTSQRASFASLTLRASALLFWLYRSHHGVFLFFVLSGFLIGRMWWPRQAHAATARFAWRRTLRIYPAFLLAFAARSPSRYASGTWTPPDWPRLVGNLLLLNGAPAQRRRAVQHRHLVAVLRDDVLSRVPAASRCRCAHRGRALRRAHRASRCRSSRRSLGADALVLCWSLLFAGVALAADARARAWPRDARRRRRRRLPRDHHARDARRAAADGRPSSRSAAWPRAPASRIACEPSERRRARSARGAAARARPRELLVLPGALDDRGAGGARQQSLRTVRRSWPWRRSSSAASCCRRSRRARRGGSPSGPTSRGWAIPARVSPRSGRRRAPRLGAASAAHTPGAGAHITTRSGPSPSASQPRATIASRTARSVV